MVAVLLSTTMPVWASTLSVAVTAVTLPTLLVLFTEPGDRPSLRRVLGACLVVLVMAGGCVLFASEGEAVMMNPCSQLEKDSWLWLLNLCWLY